MPPSRRRRRFPATVCLGLLACGLAYLGLGYLPFRVGTYGTLIVVLGAGPVIYLIASTLRKRRDQLDLSMAMRELPPE